MTTSQRLTINDFEIDVACLDKIMGAVSDAAARAATRRNCEKCLLGDPRDAYFFVNTILLDARPEVLRHVAECHAKKILDAAPAVLDNLIQERLRTIDETDLARLLAETERLGYDKRDIINSDEDNTLETMDPAERKRRKVGAAGLSQSSLLSKMKREEGVIVISDSGSDSDEHTKTPKSKLAQASRRML